MGISALNRIGIFGGTFDPVHVGHITLAEELKKHLALDAMYLLPCRLPAHREIPVAPHQDRLQMLRLATANTSLLIDERELQRDGPSYTVDTLQSLRKHHGSATSIVWCMGMDAFAAFNTWHRWQEILSLAHLAAVTRAGKNIPLPDDVRSLLTQHECHDAASLHEHSAGNIYLAQLSQIPVSSTQVRQQLAKGLSPTAALNPAVYDYIQARGLYLNQ